MGGSFLFMADNIRYGKEIKPTGIVKDIDDMINYSSSARKTFEKRWYDNNFLMMVFILDI